MLELHDEHLKEARLAASALSDEFFKTEIFNPYEDYKPKHLEKARLHLLSRYTESEISEIVRFLKTEPGKKFLDTEFGDSPYEIELDNIVEALYNKVLLKLDGGL